VDGGLSAEEIRQQAALIYQLALEVYERFGGQISTQVLSDLASGRLRSVGAARASLARVEALLAEMNAEVVPIAAIAISRAFLSGNEQLDLDPAAVLGPQDELRLQLAIDTLTGYLNELATGTYRAVADEYQMQALRSSLIGVGRANERLRDAPNAITAEGELAFVDRAGRVWNMATYAELVLRTSVMEAHTLGMLAQAAQAGHDLVTVSSHPHPEDVCSEFDGQTFSISGTSDTYPPLTEAPPFHPNCLHVLVAGPSE
jgi:proteasome lid subunit RPN8/RPN11